MIFIILIQSKRKKNKQRTTITLGKTRGFRDRNSITVR